MPKLLIVGQVPPPLGGQSIMIERLVNAPFETLEVVHVNMDFSDDMNVVGKFRLRKLLVLAETIVKVISAKIREKPDYLYYPPAGPRKIPMYRDIIILTCCRWMFRKTIFHFHAGGVSQLYDQIPGWMKPFYRSAYYNPDLSIFLSRYNPRDSEALFSLKSVEIPYGIPDESIARGERTDSPVCRILFVAVLCRSKGICDLIHAASFLQSRGVKFQVDVLGRFESDEFEVEVLELVHSLKLSSVVQFHGVQSGEAKNAFYRRADIFCFPTFFESETFGVVLLEAMQHGVPVVATEWRGVQSVVREGITGFLVPINSPESLADKVFQLAVNEGLRHEMGANGREVYEQEYMMDLWYNRIEECILSLN